MSNTGLHTNTLHTKYERHRSNTVILLQISLTAPPAQGLEELNNVILFVI